MAQGTLRPPYAEYDRIKTSRKSNESRQISGSNVGVKRTATAVAGSVRESGCVHRKSATTFTKVILAKYQLYIQTRRLDRLLKKSAEIQLLKKKSASLPPPPPGPPQVYPFLLPLSTATTTSTTATSSQDFLRKAYLNPELFPNVGTPVTTTPVTPSQPLGKERPPSYIPLDFPFQPTTTSAKGSSKKDEKHSRSSSKVQSSGTKLGRDIMGSAFPSPPIINLDVPLDTFVASHSSKNVGGHGTKSGKKFNDKMRAEATVLQRMAELQRQGMVYESRMPKLVEPGRLKTQWDYLLEEMEWMAADFAQERKWKGAAARKCARMIEKYWRDREDLTRKLEKDEALVAKKTASFIAKEIRNFWANVQRLVEYKELSKIEELRKKTVNLHLNMMVDQTEKFADMVASSFRPDSEAPTSEQPVPGPVPGSAEEDNKMETELTETASDDDFKPDGHVSDDDEDTIARAEGKAADVAKEVDLLAKESILELSEICPQWLLDRVRPKRVPYGDDISFSDEGSFGTPDEESEDSEKTDSDATSEQTRSSDAESESDETEIEPVPGKDEVEQMWDLTALMYTFSPRQPATAIAGEQELSSVTQLAQSFQPTGCTLSSTNVKTKVPILLKHTLREYQHVGLDWLVTMFEKKLNGILADEMGLGKTIQTIALLAHLACENANWGPHLIIVPTSVMLNWEMEFKKWCPGFKILTYYGSIKERRVKRKGWTKPNTFHVCITSYKLVVQDHHVFRRKAWKYLILDEAQNIKNFKSQRWQLLLNFNARRRLLLTGTPLQNNLMELWSLLHFLMPNVFQSHREFRDWFSNPVTGMVEGNADYNENIIRRLHKVLRPFILRRLKSEVEKQLPKKHEHVVMCHLSKRQRFLYEEFMSRTRTRDTLATGNLLSVINVLMQLRKVCNHPNLFESRPIISPLRTEGVTLIVPSLVWNMLENEYLKTVAFTLVKPTEYDHMLGHWNAAQVRLLRPPTTFIQLGRNLALDEVIAEHNRLYVPTTTGIIPKKTTYEFNDGMIPGSPHSKSKFPVVLISDVDPTDYFEDKEFFGALYHEADRLNQQQFWRPRIRTPPRKRNASPEKLRIPTKVAKLSTGQIELVKTPTGGHGVVLTGSSYAGELSTPAKIVEIPSTTESNSPVMIVDAEPLAYSPILAAKQIRSVSAGPVKSRTSSPEITFLGTEGPAIEEKYGPPKKLIRHLSELAPLTPNERTAHVEFNPFFKFRNEVEEKAKVALSCIAQSTTVVETRQKRKLSDDEQSDEYEDSEEDLTASSTTSRQSNQTRKEYRPAKREFKPEDANLEINMYENRSLKRREAPPKYDPNAGLIWMRANDLDPLTFVNIEIEYRRLMSRRDVIVRLNKKNLQRCKAHPFYGYDTVDVCSVFRVPHRLESYRVMSGLGRDHKNKGYFNLVQTYRNIQNAHWNHIKNHPTVKWRFTSAFINAIGTSETIIQDMIRGVLPSVIYIPSVESPSIRCRIFHPAPSRALRTESFNVEYQNQFKDTLACLHPITNRMATQFPDPRLIQYDCGKLQKLDILLRRLSSEDHRVLIFTQMTKMLDVLEAFLNYHGYIYLRLDGSTKIDQRQLLMEKFNTDRRIFCFILSTRSGGIGVNLTGADTVIFYDSDWNPTMDAQAQDRCHRIGQTRDVHIYRLVSEKTVEENILLKSNQKRLLGELAIEGGNFTTAHFKKNTIRDLFDTQVDLSADPMFSKQDDATSSLKSDKEKEDDKTKFLLLESALASAEDETDVQAARNVRAEAAAELAEFDENIPLETIGEAQDDEPPSAAAAEMKLIMAELTAIERFAFTKMEANIHEWTTETFESAAKVVENQKRQWELDQLALNEQKNVQQPVESSDDEEMITYSASDAQNKVWIAQDFEGEFMPLWEPPTPPADDTDVYIDTSLQTLYHQDMIPEHDLPPVYVPPLKKKAVVSPKPTTSGIGYPPLIPSPTQMDISTDQKKLPLKTHKREEPIFAPKSLFERPNPQVNKLRRDFKLQKHNRPAHVSPAVLPPPVTPAKPLGPDSVSFPVVSPPAIKGTSPSSLDNPPWTVQEDNALLEGVTTMCELPQSLMVVSPSQTVNWDLIGEHVNQISITHRSPKQCKTRYETVVGPREEGKMIFDSPALVKKKKSKAFVKIGPPSPQRARPQIKTAQLMVQDNYQKYTDVFINRFESMKNLSMRKMNQTLVKPPGTQKVGKQSIIFTEHGINYDIPLSAQAIAMARLERIQQERRKVIAAQEAARIAAQEAARIAAQTPIGTITLPAGQTLSVQGGTVQQQSNSLLLQTLPQKLTPAQMELLKQNLMNAQLRQSQLSGNTSVPLRPPYQRAPDSSVSLQGVKRIQVVPNSAQSTMGSGGVSFAIASSTVTTTAQTQQQQQHQGAMIPFSSAISTQSSPIIQSQLQSSNIPPGTIYQRNTDALSAHNVKRIQVVPNSLQANVGGVTYAITAPTASNVSQQNIITLSTSGAASSSVGQMVGPLPPVSVFQRGGADSVSLQGVKRIQVVSNTIQPGGITFTVTTTAPSTPTTQHSLISIAAPIVTLAGPTVGQQHPVSAPIITMAPVVSAVSTVQSLGSLLSTPTTATRFHNIQGAGGSPLATLIKSPAQKPGQQQTFISSSMPLSPLNTLRPVIVRPRTYPQQQMQSLQMQQLTQQQQAQLVVSSGTSQHSIFTLSSPITSTGQNTTQRVTLVQQGPMIAVTNQSTQAQPIIAIPSSQISSITSTTASNLQARLQALPGTTGAPATTLVKAPVAPKLPAQTFISTPIQYTPVKPGTTTQAQIPTQLIVQATSKQLPASLQQFQQVFKQVIFRQPVQMLQGQTVAVSLGGTLARPAASQTLPIRTSVPISAIAQITGQPQTQGMPRRMPLTLPVSTLHATVSSTAPEASSNTPRFQTINPPLTTAPLIPNISKEAPPIMSKPPIQIDTSQFESSTPKSGPEEGSGSSQG